MLASSHPYLASSHPYKDPMFLPRLRHRATFWAPRTLVALSCALALLAVQPAGAAPTARNRSTVLKVTGTATSTSWESTHRATLTPLPAARTKFATEAFFTNKQRLHILATVEILQRLLVAELQPTQQQFLTSLWMLPECPTLIIVPLTTSTTIHAPIFPYRTLPEAEKAYAMAHCQLAPPTAATI